MDNVVKTNWRATYELRYLVCEPFSTAMIVNANWVKLQQKWVGEDYMLRKYYEWRDVPVEEEL